MFDESDENSDNANDNDDNELEIEKQSNLLDKQHQENEILAEEELQTNIEQREKFVLPDAGNDEEDGGEIKDSEPEDLGVVQTRIQECIRILNNFSQFRDQGRSRPEYISQILKDIGIYYGYNEFLCEMLFHLFPVSEVF
jgi:ribosomal RNA methyltransferase Nop2